MLKKIVSGITLTLLLVGMLTLAFGIRNFSALKVHAYNGSGTIVGGYISENITWTLEGSPYIIIENVIVTPGVTLSIEPGVIVKFVNGTELIIDGALIAQGNVTHRILFTSNFTTPQPGDWGGIRFRDKSDDARCIIDWAIIQYASFGVFPESASPTIQNSIVRWNRYGIYGNESGLSVINSTILENVGYGIYGQGRNVIWKILNSNISSNWGYGICIVSSRGSSVAVDNCYILNNRFTGIFLNIGESSGAVISNNRVLNNGSPEAGFPKDGVRAHAVYYSSLLISNNTLFGNNGSGIYASVGQWSSLLISDNKVVGNNGTGVFINMDYGEGCNVNLSKNIVSNNNGTGIYLEWKYYPPTRFVASELTVIFNNQSGIISNIGPVYRSKIFSNFPYDFVVVSYGDVNATFNWWGTTNETAIKEHIYDYYDDYNLGRVIYKPYLVPPIANFTFSPEMPYACGTVTFDASASFNPYGSIINYTWDFGDGNITTVTSPIITHTYTKSGNFNVTLAVTDEFGLTNSTTTTITVLQDKSPPVTTDNYDGLWHNTDFTITLTATDNETGVAETYYKINGGSVKAVSVDGQPVITTEGTNNTLEYWSVDYAGNEESHKFLTGIKLDKTSPLITSHFRFPDDDVEPNEPVKVAVNVTDFLSDVKNCTVSYRIAGESTWINIPMTLNQTTMLYEAFIQIQELNVEVEYRIIAYDNAGNVALEDNNGQYYTYTVIPEFPSAPTLLLAIIITSFTVIISKRKLQNTHANTAKSSPF